jgi:hypothetical protein
MNSYGARLATVGIATLALAPLTGLGVAANAGDNDFREIRTGDCSGSADWKLKVKRDDGRLEVEFEVDSNRNGQVWRVRMTRDGNVFMSGTRTTRAPSGSFDVERKISNSAGDDVVVGRATHNGQVCRGRLVYTH